MGKNTDRSFLFFFRGICCLVFAYSHVKEASTGIIRTMHTQKKRQGGRRGRGGRGGKPRWNRNGAKVSAVGATKMAERRGRCRLFLLICEITLSLFLSVLFSPSFLPFYSPSFSLAILPPHDLSPCQSLLFLGLPDSLECESDHSILLHRPLSRHDRSQNRLIFCSIAFAPMHAPIYRYNYCLGCLSFHHQNTIPPLRGFSRFACFRLTFHKRTRDLQVCYVRVCISMYLSLHKYYFICVTCRSLIFINR